MSEMTATPLPETDAPADAWLGRRLGERTVSWADRDPILFALALGARPDELDMIFEDRLRVLPSFALTLAQWAPDLLGGAGAFDVGTAVHGSQDLEVLGQLPVAGELSMVAEVTGVWDKGEAAVFEVCVESTLFRATWSIFAPGCGGFGGERGPGRTPAQDSDPTQQDALSIADNAAVLYRLLGDRHHFHIDPDAAAGIGQPRPILHGLATLSASTLALARLQGAHPADLTRLAGRFAGPVFPGETLQVRRWDDGAFEVHSERGPAISGGRAEFG